MIKDPETYRHQSEGARWQALRRMTAEESIALGEALLTSELMQYADLSPRDRPINLAVALGIVPRPPEKGGRGDR
jgi:hypothetical protein